LKAHIEHKNLLQFDLLNREKGIDHFTTTRTGGVSEGTFSSLNLGNFSDDNPVNIFENLTILSRMWYKSPDQFIVPHQTHGTGIKVIDEQFLNMSRHEQNECLYGIDATITHLKDIFLCVTTADCVPLLLYDPKNKVVAGIHAGWRGTVNRIVEKVITTMGEVYGTSTSDIIAGIGPAICIKDYEVGHEVEEQFITAGFNLTNDSFRQTPSSKLHIDLKGLNYRELLRMKVPIDQIEISDYCTFENANLFFSARRQTVHCGRMLSAILLK